MVRVGFRYVSIILALVEERFPESSFRMAILTSRMSDSRIIRVIRSIRQSPVAVIQSQIILVRRVWRQRHSMRRLIDIPTRHSIRARRSARVIEIIYGSNGVIWQVLCWVMKSIGTESFWIRGSVRRGDQLWTEKSGTEVREIRWRMVLFLGRTEGEGDGVGGIGGIGQGRLEWRYGR